MKDWHDMTTDERTYQRWIWWEEDRHREEEEAINAQRQYEEETTTIQDTTYHCPECNTADVEGGEVTTAIFNGKEMTAEQKMVCCNCFACWTDIYLFVKHR